MSAKGETLNLPDLLESVLGAGELDALFRDLAALTEVREIIPKRGPRDYVGDDPPAFTLEGAREQLLSGAVRGLQIRYDYDGAQYWDTLLPAAGGFRIVRIRHEFGEG